MIDEIKLYTYFRSSAAYRVRIALNLKGLSFESIPVHLLRDGGAQHSADYVRLNATRLVPTLVDGALTTGQSLAIIEYLEERYPTPALLPQGPADRARVRANALSIACEIHPLNNLRVLGYLTKTLGLSDDEKNAWYRHWVETGLAAVEAQLAHDPRTGAFCHGDAASLADICLVPQIFNAQRFNCKLDHVPTVMRVFDRCLSQAAFADAIPAKQPDAE